VSVALAGCGGSTSSNTPVVIHPNYVDIYASLPMIGPEQPEAAQILSGIYAALAAADHRAGQFRVVFKPRNDATDAGWSAEASAANARRAASDPEAVYYIGDFDSGASEVSAPILNEAGIAQLSPGSSDVGLTQSVPGVTALHEPTQFYPTGKPTFLRLLPSDAVQAAADLAALRLDGCSRVAVANDGADEQSADEQGADEQYGQEISRLLLKTSNTFGRYYGVSVVSVTSIKPSDLSGYVDALRAQGANCFEFAGSDVSLAVRAAVEVHNELPAAAILVPAALCTSAFTNPRDGGVPPVANIDHFLQCTSPTLSVSAYPGHRRFAAAYAASAYARSYGGAQPGPYAIIGYEAMQLGLATIAARGSNGDNRLDVLHSLFSTRNRASVLGEYSFAANGDSTLPYGLYRVGPRGNPMFIRALSPAFVL
jgi:branched-chain amino acid transport system substrate-binding protein